MQKAELKLLTLIIFASKILSMGHSYDNFPVSAWFDAQLDDGGQLFVDRMRGKGVA